MLITGQENINAYMLLSCRAALKMESIGLKARRGANAKKAAIQHWASAFNEKLVLPRGNKEALAAFELALKDKGILK